MPTGLQFHYVIADPKNRGITYLRKILCNRLVVIASSVRVKIEYFNLLKCSFYKLQAYQVELSATLGGCRHPPMLKMVGEI